VTTSAGSLSRQCMTRGMALHAWLRLDASCLLEASLYTDKSAEVYDEVLAR